jgi:phosphoesterase RecJ-like protein
MKPSEPAMAIIRKALLANDDFVISGHVNPDGDAIGSCLAMAQALQKLGKKVCVMLEPFNEKSQVIPGQNLIRRDCPMPEAHAFICLDCGNYERLGGSAAVMRKAAVTICVDHHISTDPAFAQYSLVCPDASSTCELVYYLLEPMVEIDRDIASAIYAGILTDTGGFRHSSTSADTMYIIGDLLKRDVPFTDIYNEMLRRHTLAETMVMRRALANLRVAVDGRVAYTTLSHEEMLQIGASQSDTDGIAEYLLNIRGVEASAFLYERADSDIKVSLRSAVADISRVAVNFGGGGHLRAAGCSFTGDLKQSAMAVVQALQEAVNVQ